MAKPPVDNELRQDIARVPWFHAMELPGGITTPGAVARSEVILSLLDGIDFSGKVVLDVGCWDGMWAFEAESRGAKTVYATDDTTQRPFAESGAFEIAHRARDSAVIYRPDLSVYDVESLGVRDFDVVLFFGVYYHLKHPLYALSKLRRVCKDGAVLLIEGPAFRSRRGSYARFYYDRWHVGDASNWWVPSRKCLRDMMESSFFAVVDERRNRISRSRRGWRSAVFAALEPLGRVALDRLYPQRYVSLAQAVSREDGNYLFPDAELARFDENGYGVMRSEQDPPAGALPMIERVARWLRATG